MKAVVVYESIYGNTAQVAQAVAEGLREGVEVVVMPASDNVRIALDDADLLVVGGPTHVHGMSTEMSRRAAAADVKTAERTGVEPALEGEAVRQLLHDVGEGDGMGAAAFDTRIHKARVLTGSAARGIARRLARHDFALVAEPESFFVADTAGPLEEGERERAVEWGRMLARTVVTRAG